VPALTLPSKTSPQRTTYSPKPVRSGRRAWQDSRDHDLSASEAQSCDENLGCRRCVSTVRGYMYVCGDVLAYWSCASAYSDQHEKSRLHVLGNWI